MWNKVIKCSKFQYQIIKIANKTEKKRKNNKQSSFKPKIKDKDQKKIWIELFDVHYYGFFSASVHNDPYQHKVTVISIWEWGDCAQFPLFLSFLCACMLAFFAWSFYWLVLLHFIVLGREFCSCITCAYAWNASASLKFE